MYQEICIIIYHCYIMDKLFIEALSTAPVLSYSFYAPQIRLKYNCYYGKMQTIKKVWYWFQIERLAATENTFICLFGYDEKNRRHKKYGQWFDLIYIILIAFHKVAAKYVILWEFRVLIHGAKSFLWRILISIFFWPIFKTNLSMDNNFLSSDIYNH